MHSAEAQDTGSGRGNKRTERNKSSALELKVSAQYHAVIRSVGLERFALKPILCLTTATSSWEDE